MSTGAESWPLAVREPRVQPGEAPLKAGGKLDRPTGCLTHISVGGRGPALTLLTGGSPDYSIKAIILREENSEVGMIFEHNLIVE